MRPLGALRSVARLRGRGHAVQGGDVLVAFRSRAAAEQGYAKGAHIAAIGPVQLAWFSGQATSAAARGASAAPDASKEGEDEGAGAPADDDAHMHMHMPEEVEAGGWGGDDDGFGMM